MNWFDLCVVFPIGFMYPSFKLYVAVARRQPIEIFLKHFVVMSISLAVIQVINAIFGTFWLLTLIKIIVLWILIGNNFSGSGIFFDYILRTLATTLPFIIEFGYNAHSSSLQQLSQDVLGHFEEIFVRKYLQILDEIDE